MLCVSLIDAICFKRSCRNILFIRVKNVALEYNPIQTNGVQWNGTQSIGNPLVKCLHMGIYIDLEYFGWLQAKYGRILLVQWYQWYDWCQWNGTYSIGVPLVKCISL